MPFYPSYGKHNAVDIKEYILEVLDDLDNWAPCPSVTSHPFCGSGSDIGDKTSRCNNFDHNTPTV